MAKKKSEKEDLIITVDNSRIEDLLDCVVSIEDSIDKDYYVAGDLFNRLMNILFYENQKKNEENRKKSEKLIKEVILFIKKPRRNFHFSYKENSGRFIRNTSVPAKLSFEDMMDSLPLDSFWSSDYFENKTSVTQLCYKAFDDYTKKDKRIRDQYSHRKITILTAYIVYKMDRYKLSNALQECKDRKDEPSTVELYTWLDDSFPKVKTYKSKKRFS